MKTTTLRLTLAALGAALLAACGGGGGSAPGTTPAITPAGPSNPGSGSSAHATGNGTTRLTVSFTPGAPRTTHSAAYIARLAAATKRTDRGPAAVAKPQYVSGSTNGFQVTVTPAGGTPTIYNFAANVSSNANCNSNGPLMTCALVVPTLGATETIAVQDVNNQPSGTIDPTTGIAASPSSFPIGTVVLATGTTPATTLTPGAVTSIALSLNPVLGNIYDCGFDSNSNNMREDYSVNPRRIVMTGNVASSGVLFPEPADYTGDSINTSTSPTTLQPVFQPFVDVDGTTKAPTATISSNVSPYLGLFAAQGGVAPVYTAPLTGLYGATASFPDTSYIVLNNSELDVPIRYSGFGTLAATIGGGTLTLKSNLTATAPFNTNPTPAQINYVLAPLFLTASATTAAVNSSTLVLTGYDPGPNAYGYMNTTNCYDAHGNDLGSPSSNGNLTNGVQTWTFNAGSQTGVCTLYVSDVWTGVPTNPVTITIQ
jgi:hypothetical protein